MNDWSDSKEIPLRHYDAITHVLQHHDNLLRGLFDTCPPRLNGNARALLAHYKRCLPNQEYILIRVALDIWDSSGNAKIGHILDQLDARSFLNVINGLVLARKSRIIYPDF